MAKISTGPGGLDLEIYAGDINELLLEFLCRGDPWDITGATISAQARLTDLDPTVAISATVTVTDPGNGLAVMVWDGEDVRTLLAGSDKWSGVWDMELLEVSKPLPRTMLRGNFTAQLDVTRSGP